MIYIDSNVLVYAVVDFGAKGKAAREVMRLIDDGALEAMTSALTMDELMWVFLKSGRKDSMRRAVAGFYESLLRVVPVSSQAPLGACALVEECGLGPRDALHAAVMKENRVTEILSEDRHFDRVKWLKRRSLRGLLDGSS